MSNQCVPCIKITIVSLVGIPAKSFMILLLNTTGLLGSAAHIVIAFVF